MHSNKNNNGSVVIAVILFMILMMSSAAIVLSGTLSRHIRAAQNYLSSERAFTAANSGIEDMLYQLQKQGIREGIEVDSQIEYGRFTASYKGNGNGFEQDGKIYPCMTSAGTYRSLVRRLELGGGSDGCSL